MVEVLMGRLVVCKTFEDVFRVVIVLWFEVAMGESK